MFEVEFMMIFGVPAAIASSKAIIASGWKADSSEKNPRGGRL